MTDPAQHEPIAEGKDFVADKRKEFHEANLAHFRPWPLKKACRLLRDPRRFNSKSDVTRDRAHKAALKSIQQHKDTQGKEGLNAWLSKAKQDWLVLPSEFVQWATENRLDKWLPPYVREGHRLPSWQDLFEFTLDADPAEALEQLLMWAIRPVEIANNLPRDLLFGIAGAGMSKPTPVTTLVQALHLFVDAPNDGATGYVHQHMPYEAPGFRTVSPWRFLDAINAGIAEGTLEHTTHRETDYVIPLDLVSWLEPRYLLHPVIESLMESYRFSQMLNPTTTTEPKSKGDEVASRPRSEPGESSAGKADESARPVSANKGTSTGSDRDYAANARAAKQRKLELRNQSLVREWQTKMKSGRKSRTAACRAVACEHLKDEKAYRTVERAVKAAGLWA